MSRPLAGRNAYGSGADGTAEEPDRGRNVTETLCLVRAREFDCGFAVAPVFQPPPDSLLTHSQQKRISQKCFISLLACFYSVLACFFLYSLVFLLYSSPRGAPEAPNERFPEGLQGFGQFRVSPAGRNVFSLLVQQMPPGGAEIAVFPMVWRILVIFGALGRQPCFFLYSLVFFFTRLFFFFTRHE